MGLAKLKTKISVEEYLESEKTSPVKREYVQGDVFVMAGTTDNHNRLAGKIYSKLETHLEGNKCEPFFGDIKVRVTRNIYYYPDVLVSCEENPEDPHFRNQPILIVEVLSDSTERTDRGEKSLFYLQMPSLSEYVIVSQKSRLIEIHRRQSNGGWEVFLYDETDEEVEFTSVDLKMTIAEIYRRVVFEEND